jgi:hypothetical protein
VTRGDSSSLGRPKISDIVPNGSMRCQISRMLNVGKLLLCRLALFETIDAKHNAYGIEYAPEPLAGG